MPVTISDNKADLANILTEDLIHRAKDTQQNGELITACGADTSPLQSTQEDADTRIVLHAPLTACQNSVHFNLLDSSAKRFGLELELLSKCTLLQYMPSRYLQSFRETYQRIMH